MSGSSLDYLSINRLVAIVVRVVVIRPLPRSRANLVYECEALLVLVLLVPLVLLVLPLLLGVACETFLPSMLSARTRRVGRFDEAGKIQDKPLKIRVPDFAD